MLSAAFLTGQQISDGHYSVRLQILDAGALCVRGCDRQTPKRRRPVAIFNLLCEGGLHHGSSARLGLAWQRTRRLCRSRVSSSSFTRIPAAQGTEVGRRCCRMCGRVRPCTTQRTLDNRQSRSSRRSCFVEQPAMPAEHRLAFRRAAAPPELQAAHDDGPCSLSNGACCLAGGPLQGTTGACRAWRSSRFCDRTDCSRCTMCLR